MLILYSPLIYFSTDSSSRGKKVFRRFHSLPDAGSRAGSDDEGDLEEGLNPASIKPRLLFPSADPPSHHSEAEQDAAVAGSAGVDDDEEAETDIDETASLAAASQSSIVISSKVITTKRKAVSRMTPEDDDDGEIVVKHQQPLFPATPRKKATPGKGRGKRVSAAAALFDDDEDGSFIDNLVRLSDDEAPPTLITKKAAPSPRGTKRRVEFGLDTPPQTVKKKTRRTFALN